MLDPFFPVALFCGPLALLILLRVEARRTTPSFWPRYGSSFLALVAVWGLTFWVSMIGVGLFGERMTEDGFQQLSFLAILISMSLVAASYSVVARQRMASASR